MKTITIIFIGLIAHVNQPWSFDNTAVVVNAHGHTANMSIPTSAVVNHDDPWLRQWPQINNSYVIPLKGLRVRLENTRGVFSDRSQTLIDSVPPLKKLAPTCKLKREIVARAKTDDVVAYIDYRGGRVSPDMFFAEKLVFEGTEWNDGRCVACRIRYDADLRGDEARLVFTDSDNEHVLRVAGNSTVEVQNAPTVGTGFSIAGATSGHFGHHYSILQCDRAPVRPVLNGVCDKPDVCLTPSSTPTPFPTPTPFGDCTGSNYP
ncbi:MAG TPA: hypothetical protein VNA69_13985 [Thermoanaerobaculia bacterium]|nr:hypothetical protein [Thermoanaerobaculia bacterium]